MTSPFKIYSLLVVKNEADIIGYSLLDACRWSDKIIVIDNGSSDQTWQIVNQMSKRHPQIIPWLRYEGAFHIGLRAKAFREFRHEMTSDDWWCVRLDADELYDTDVRAFLSSVPRKYTIIKKQSTDFVLTHEDLQQYVFTGDFNLDHQHITHHLPQQRQERRFIRHSPLLIWLDHWRYPHPWGRVAPMTIPVNHYQYRSPQQMQMRFLTRQTAIANNCGSFHHEKGKTWQDYLYSNNQLREQFIVHNIQTEFAASENIIYRKRNTVKQIDDLIIKRFRRPVLVNRIIYGLFRKSKAHRSFIYAKRLGNITPEPIAFVDFKQYGLLQDSYYICRKSHLPYTFRQLEHDKQFPNRWQHIEALACFTAMLHNQGILHPDYSGGNILFNDEDMFQIIDLNRLRFCRHISRYKGLRNLNRLLLTDDEKQNFIRIYLDNRNL